MPRHRGTYDPLHSSPYELSRSRVENFVRCPDCFYMQQVEGIKFPDIPGFNFNEAADLLLKNHLIIIALKLLFLLFSNSLTHSANRRETTGIF